MMFLPDWATEITDGGLLLLVVQLAAAPTGLRCGELAQRLGRDERTVRSWAVRLEQAGRVCRRAGMYVLAEAIGDTVHPSRKNGSTDPVGTLQSGTSELKNGSVDPVGQSAHTKNGSTDPVDQHRHQQNGSVDPFLVDVTGHDQSKNGSVDPVGQSAHTKNGSVDPVGQMQPMASELKNGSVDPFCQPTGTETDLQIRFADQNGEKRIYRSVSAENDKKMSLLTDSHESNTKKNHESESQLGTKKSKTRPPKQTSLDALSDECQEIIRIFSLRSLLPIQAAEINDFRGSQADWSLERWTRNAEAYARVYGRSGQRNNGYRFDAVRDWYRRDEASIRAAKELLADDIRRAETEGSVPLGAAYRAEPRPGRAEAGHRFAPKPFSWPAETEGG